MALVLVELIAKGQPDGLKTEHLVTPLGIDVPHPRLSRRLNPDMTPGARPDNYTVVLGTDSASVASGLGSWEITGPGSQQRVRYQGPALRPFTRYYWNVRTGFGKKASRSAVSWFETGMMDQSRWKGSWITDTRDTRLKPAAYFRRGFQVKRQIKSARVYIAAAGLYELSINGKKVGDHVLDPMYTRFDRRNLYVTYDVTKLPSGGGQCHWGPHG